MICIEISLTSVEFYLYSCSIFKHFEPLNTDLDGDLVGDVCDNCGGTTNTDQLNADHDSFGDVCDSDIDNDGLDNSLDNCLTVANPSQNDSDSDTVRSLQN